jgi:hypothetical protein
MHNFNLTSIPTPQQSVTNLSILEESCNNNSYSHWVGASVLHDNGSGTFATYVAATSTTPEHWKLVNAATSGVGFYVRRHSDWEYGSFDLNVHWSTDVGLNNVVMSVTATPFISGSTVPAVTDCPFTVAAGIRNAIVVTKLSSAALRQSSLIDRSKCGIYVRLSRVGADGSDTNTGDVSIYGIELVYNEAKRVIGDTIKK